MIAKINHRGIRHAIEDIVMKLKMNKSLILFPITAIALTLAACDVDKVEDGELPDVNVEGETKLPKYDVDGPDVEIGKKKVEMEVPTIDIDVPDEEDNESVPPATEPTPDPTRMEQ
jgi:hypothetical protein